MTAEVVGVRERTRRVVEVKKFGPKTGSGEQVTRGVRHFATLLSLTLILCYSFLRECSSWEALAVVPTVEEVVSRS